MDEIFPSWSVSAEATRLVQIFVKRASVLLYFSQFTCQIKNQQLICCLLRYYLPTRYLTDSILGPEEIFVGQDAVFIEVKEGIEVKYELAPLKGGESAIVALAEQGHIAHGEQQRAIFWVRSEGFPAAQV